MTRSPLRAVFLLLSICTPWIALAQEEPAISGRVAAEAGTVQDPGGTSRTYQYSRIIVQSQNDLNETMSWVFQGEADQQTSSTPMGPSWPLNSPNVVDLQADDLATSNGTVFTLARLDRAYLRWSSGPLELTGGIWRPEVGSASFYRPTDYFDPVAPLAWVPEPALGSEGGEARCSLFDDLSAAVAARWLSGGRMEWTARLIDKNIAYRVTPSFTHGTGRDGLGLEASGTFPDLQVHLEGTEWFFNGGAERLEGLVGLSGVFQGTEWTLECLQDGTGEALGTLSTGNLPATYLFASAQRPFTGEWQAQASLVKAVEGGPFLLWPKVSWEFEPRWKLLFQAQWPLGKGPGPLALEPGRTGVSMDYSF